MDTIETKMRKKLNTSIADCVKRRDLFKNPETDFTKSRKLTPERVAKIFVNMNGNSLKKEIKEEFNYDKEMPSVSALIQQNEKLTIEFYDHLFKTFTSQINRCKTFMGHHLLAGDGSSINIRFNKQDDETFIKNQSNGSGYNAVHLNALYDLNNNFYPAFRLQNGNGSELRAMIDMIDNVDFCPNTIVVLDRYFESYNLFAHVEQKGLKYVVRIKDVDSTGILNKYNLPKDKEFDIHIRPIITKKQSKEVKNNKAYTLLKGKDDFDFVDLQNNWFYEMDIRVVRIEIAPGEFECLATNLDEDNFNSSALKEIYFRRWGIETSFRVLKYNFCLNSLHFKKLESISKEIYAKITMFNYCRAIINAIVIHQKQTLYIYQANIASAIDNCKESFKRNDDSIDVVALIQKDLLPVRPNRQFQRNLMRKHFVWFAYRAA